MHDLVIRNARVIEVTGERPGQLVRGTQADPR